MLAKPVMATIFIGPESKKFVIHKDVLCSNSEYFKAALSGRFKEAETKEMGFPDVQPAIFRTVVHWVYTGITEFEDGSLEVDLSNFQAAYQVYFWADSYETIHLRHQILDIISGVSEQGEIVPHPAHYGKIFKTLPENSGLCKFLVDYLVEEWFPLDEKVVKDFVDVLPNNVIARMIFKFAHQSVVGGRDQLLYVSNRCAYHKHRQGEDCNPKD